ncbi:EpsG family protein [Clostridiales bacterium AM23-16LB]|nr:EpsG family protein [Clostridiales bacterium AM23-16LB]
MNLYLIVLLLLAAGAVLEWFLPKYQQKIFTVCWCVTTAVVALRFGQGTDYATYEGIYRTIPTVIDLSKGYICGFYPEMGWRLFCAFFKLFQAPFWTVTMAAAVIEMLLFGRFLKKYVPYQTTGLFLSYPVLIFVYMVSGLRQAMAICIFLGLALPFYLEKKWIQYVISVLLAASFHKVGYGWLVLVIAYYIPVWGMVALTGAATAVGLIIQIPVVTKFILQLIPSYHMWRFLWDGTMSLFAVGERVVSFAVLLIFYVWFVRQREDVPRQIQLLFKVYSCGVCFYMLMCCNSYYASRYAAIFKVVECAVMAGLVACCRSSEDMMVTEKPHIGTDIPFRKYVGTGVMAFFLCLTLVMGVKNLHAAVSEGGYDKLGVNLFTYPYVSVLNQQKINDYYDYQEKTDRMYEYNLEDQQLWMLESQEEP